MGEKVMTVSSKCSLSVVLSAVEMSRTTQKPYSTSSVTIDSNYSHTCVLPCILDAATIQGQCPFEEIR